MYVLGAIFLFASCQSDELQSDEVLVMNNDVILMKAIESFKNYKSTKQSSTTAYKSDNANRVTKEMVIKYSRGNIDVVVNPDACGANNPPLQFVLNGGGIASLIGQYTVLNIACIGPDGLEDPLLGFITAANGDEIYTELFQTIPDDDKEDFATLDYDIIGGSGRFEGATGKLYIYGEIVLSGPYEAVGWATITY